MEHNPPSVRILHLEDYPADALLISTLIDDANHEFSASVDSVSTKEAYLSALRSHSYDLILSDYRMPGYDGDDALRDARAICPDVPFIMVTGELGEDRAVETLKAGATDYVLKDRIKRLIPSIKRALKDAQLEQERHETTTRLIEAQRIAHIGNWEWNIQTGEVHWSAEIFSIYGLDPAAFAPSFDAFAQFVHPEDREFVNGKVSEILASGVPVSLDFRIIASDGAEHVLHTVAEIKRFDALGKPLVMAGTNQDITARRRAEEVLRKSEERFRSLAENLPSVLMRYDREFRVVYLSPMAEAFTGVSVEKFLGKTNREVGMPDDLCTVWEEAIEEVFRTGENRDVEFSFQAAEGLKTFFLRFAPEKAVDGTIDYVLGISTDITERKQAEEELATAYTRIQSIIDNTPAIVYAFDLEKRFVIANIALAELLNSTPEAMLGKRRHDFMPRKDADWHEANDRQVIEAGKALAFEEYSQLPGRAITWLTTKFPLRDAQGRIYAVAGISSDISERKLAEAKLAESEEKYRDLFEKMSEGFLLVEPIYSEAGSPVSYYYRDANPALEQLTHLKRTEIIGKSAHEVLGVVEPHWVECFARVARSGKSERIEEYSKGLGGWYSVYVYCPKPGMAALIYTNVTERRKAEEALAASERKHRELLQTANSIILRWDNQGILHFVNDYGLRFFGYRREELLGRDVMTLAPKVEQSTGRNLESLVGDILRHPERFTDYANENIRKDGTTVWVAWTNKAILDEHGKVREILAIGNDITPLKKAEEDLRTSEKRYRMLHESLRDPFVTVSMDGQILDCNKLYCDMLGYTFDELRKLTYQDITPERWHASEEKLVQEQIVGRGYSDVYEKEYRRKDGSLVPVELRTILSCDDLGRPVAMWGIVRDITDRKQTEQALKASQENLRLMVAQASEAMMVLDSEGTIEAVSPSGVALLGYGEGDLIGKRAELFAETFSRLELALRLEDLRRQPPKPVVTTLRLKTNSGEAQLLTLSVRIMSPGTGAEKYFVKFSKLDMPSGRPQP